MTRATTMGYRLRLSAWRRGVTVAILVLTTLFFVPGVVTGGLDLWWRVVSAVGLVSSLLGLRVVLGAAVVVRPGYLRLQRLWPIHRDIVWYRILEVDVIPGFWNLEIELNSGERIALPCVEHVDHLYENLEAHRSQIGA